MPFADFGSSIFDTFDGIGNVLLGQTRVHRDVEAAFVEVSAGFRALIRIVTEVLETVKELCLTGNTYARDYLGDDVTE